MKQENVTHPHTCVHTCTHTQIPFNRLILRIQNIDIEICIDFIAVIIFISTGVKENMFIMIEVGNLRK